MPALQFSSHMLFLTNAPTCYEPRHKLVAQCHDAGDPSDYYQLTLSTYRSQQHNGLRTVNAQYSNDGGGDKVDVFPDALKKLGDDVFWKT